MLNMQNETRWKRLVKIVGGVCLFMLMWALLFSKKRDCANELKFSFLNQVALSKCERQEIGDEGNVMYWVLFAGGEKETRLIAKEMSLREMPILFDADLHPPKNVAPWWYSPGVGDSPSLLFHGEDSNWTKVILRYRDGKIWVFFADMGEVTHRK